MSCIALTLSPSVGAAPDEAAPDEAAPDEGPEPATSQPTPATAFPPGWLDWSGPPECPGPDHVESRLVEWLGAPPASSLGLAVESRVVWMEDGWEVHVVVHLGERSGERRVRLASCSDAADFVALAVALAVNPDLDPGLTSGPEWIEATSTGTPIEGQPSDVSPLAEVEEPGEPTPPEKPPTTNPPEPPARGFAVLVGASVEMSMGALPGVHGGVEAELGLALERAQVWLAGRFLPPTSEVFGGAATPIEFSLLAARLGASYELVSGAVCLGPGASLELGAVQAGQTSGSLDPPRGSEIWAALGIGVEAALPLQDWLVPVTSVEVSIPLTRPRFVLDDGTLVHQPDVGFRAEVGARIFLWSR